MELETGLLVSPRAEVPVIKSFSVASFLCG
jgi:hypothetical protein